MVHRHLFNLPDDKRYALSQAADPQQACQCFGIKAEILDLMWVLLLIPLHA